MIVLFDEIHRFDAAAEQRFTARIILKSVLNLRPDPQSWEVYTDFVQEMGRAARASGAGERNPFLRDPRLAHQWRQGYPRKGPANG